MNGLKNLVFIKNLYLPHQIIVDFTYIYICVIYPFPHVTLAVRIFQCLAVDQEAAHRCCHMGRRDMVYIYIYDIYE